MQAFVKFFGQADNRSSRDWPVLDTVRTSGSHRICTYPRNRRPRAVRDGDLMFMGQLVSRPNDILVYGRGSRGHMRRSGTMLLRKEHRAAALARSLAALHPRPRRRVAGRLGDGVPLSELMDELSPYAFGPTAENADRGIGNVDPRKSIRQRLRFGYLKSGRAG